MSRVHLFTNCFHFLATTCKSLGTGRWAFISLRHFSEKNIVSSEETAPLRTVCDEWNNWSLVALTLTYSPQSAVLILISLRTNWSWSTLCDCLKRLQVPYQLESHFMFSHFTYTSNSVFKTEAIIFLPDRPQPMALELTTELLFLPISSEEVSEETSSPQVVLRLTPEYFTLAFKALRGLWDKLEWLILSWNLLVCFLFSAGYLQNGGHCDHDEDE